MTPHYTDILRALERASRFEKYASEGGSSAVDQALSCSEAYTLFMQKAAGYQQDSSAAGVAKAAALFALDLYDTAVDVGVKVAAAEDVGAAIEQLAAVAYVDETLKTASAGMSGHDLEATRRLQLLGREYGVELLRGLVG